MRPKILVIEDEPGVRLAVKDELEFEGFDVEVAEDGESNWLEGFMLISVYAVIGLAFFVIPA